MAETLSSSATSPYDSTDTSTIRATSWTLDDFNDIAVPSGATVNGIELLINMAGASLTDGGAYFKVNNGSIDSAAKAANENFSAFSTFSDMSIGASNDLWGISWTVTRANNISALWDVSFHAGGSTAYFDHVQVRITYTPGAPDTSGPITITSGKISLTSGLITIK
jgi:hypothetical protein